jgi:hypothetical protein
LTENEGGRDWSELMRRSGFTDAAETDNRDDGFP